MRTRLFLNSLFFLVLIWSSCSEPAKPEDKKTTTFLKYLNKEFQFTPGKGEELYFIVPTFGCAGCKKTMMSYFQSRIQKPNNYLIISERALRTLDGIEDSKNIMVDKSNTIDRLNIDASNTTLIILKNQVIESITAVTPENLDSLAQKIP